MVEFDSEPAPPALPPPISHYYGDIVRQLFFAATVLVLAGAPFYADSLRAEFPFEIAGALVLVAFGALVNPHNKNIMAGCAIASGVGAVVYQTWALFSYSESSWLQFILREGIALLFFVAFYFSIKTVRAFLLHKVGKHDEAGEFDE